MQGAPTSTWRPSSPSGCGGAGGAAPHTGGSTAAWGQGVPARRPTSAQPCRAACWSIAGDPDPGNMFFGLRPTHSLLRNWEGPSDGLVPKDSAEGWGEPLPAWPHDHFRQINWMTPPWVHPQVIRSYMELIDRIASIEEERRPKVMIQNAFEFSGVSS